LGPKNVGLTLLVPITFLYVVIFITGVIGNVAVCLVIVKNKSMHTATNYYLFSLAISDLMILVLGKLETHF
jgi:neuromedin U receptor 1